MLHNTKMWRRVVEDPIKRVGHYTLVGLFGGLIVFLIESVDRLVTLWPSFNSAYEPIAFAAYLAPIVLIGVLVGAGLGIGLVATETVFVRVRRLPQRIAPWPAGVITVVVLALLLRALLVLVPDTLKLTAADFVWRVHNQFFPTLDPYGNYTRVLVFAGLVIAVALLLFADRLLKLVLTSQSQLPRVLLCALFGVVLLCLYIVDSRFEFGRHEAGIHIPVDFLQLVTAVFLAEVAGSASGAGFWKPRATKWVTGLLITGALAACAFDAVHFGTNQNLKALLWHRSIVARRAYQIVAVIASRNDDGFASLFEGGDLDRCGSVINPFADGRPGYREMREPVERVRVVYGRMPPVFGPSQSALSLSAIAKRNLILISIDTLRADRMSCYGYSRPTAPHISVLAATGRFFERAYSQATSTGPAFASMQRSAMRGSVFDATRPTLFGLLAEAGYRTALISAGPNDVWLRKNKAWKEYCEIILKGIQETPHSSGNYWDAHEVTNEAIEHIAAIPSGTPHATWVHYLDPHSPRRKVAAFDFGDSDSDKYDSEVAFVDREVGRLIEALRASGATDNAIVVLTADHGESFGEHGATEHGNRPYDEQIHIPLMIWAPGVLPARVTQPVALIDIAPTVLAFLGIREISGAEGRNLLIDDLDARPIFSEVDANYSDPSFFSYSSFFPYAVTDGEWRLIYDVRGNTEELYEVTRDPGELHNLADAEPERLNRMHAILVHWLRNTTSVHRLS